MSSKTLLILAGLTFLVILVGLFIGQQNTSPIPQSGALLFPELKAKINEIAEITLKTKGGQVTLVRGDKSWGVKEKQGYYADMKKVRGTIIGMAELKILEPKTKNPDLYEKLGLQDPNKDGSTSTLVTFKTQDNNPVATIVIGNQRPAKGNPSVSEMYVRQPKNPQTWLVTGKLPLEQVAGEWLEKNMLNIDDKRLHRVRVVHAKGETVVIQKDKPADLDFQVADLPKNEKIKSQFTVNNIASTLGKLQLEDVKNEEEVNFAEQAGLTIVAETFDGMQVTVHTTTQDDVTYGKVSAVFDSNLIYREPEPPDSELTEEKEEGEEQSQPKDESNSEQAEDTDQSNDQKVKTEAPPKPTIKPAEEVQKEVALLNEKLNGWAFALPKFRVDNFSKRRADLLEKK